jgi:hypothetical protein
MHDTLVTNLGCIRTRSGAHGDGYGHRFTLPIDNPDYISERVPWITTGGYGRSCSCSIVMI